MTMFGDADTSSLTFITVKVAEYRSANETAYWAALLVSGANSTGYRICRGPSLAGIDLVFGPTVRTGQDAILKTSSAIDPMNNFLNARRPCVPRTAKSISFLLMMSTKR